MQTTNVYVSRIENHTGYGILRYLSFYVSEKGALRVHMNPMMDRNPRYVPEECALSERLAVEEDTSLTIGYDELRAIIDKVNHDRIPIGRGGMQCTLI